MNDPCTQKDPTSLDATARGATREPGASVAEGKPMTLPIVTETIEVGKVEVDRGGYRITKRVDARDVLVDEPLRHETIEIERRPLDRELDEGDVPAVRWEGDTMIVPVVKEIVVTRKRLVLVEEIRMTRVSGTHRDPRSVTVREEHVEVERLEPKHR